MDSGTRNTQETRSLALVWQKFHLIATKPSAEEPRFQGTFHLHCVAAKTAAAGYATIFKSDILSCPRAHAAVSVATSGDK
jgi:hypothetical protein